VLVSRIGNSVLIGGVKSVDGTTHVCMFGPLVVCFDNPWREPCTADSRDREALDRP
jgi:hypothetical protein